MTPQSTPLFDRVALIGIGLIGSSLARALKKGKLAGHVAVQTRSDETLSKAKALNLGDSYTTDAATAVAGADLVVICTPLGAYKTVAGAIAGSLKAGAIVSDVGSVKQAAFENIAPSLPAGVHLVPGHPVAGTEHSGPEAGYASLFEGHWCILTPDASADSQAVERVANLWRAIGMEIEIMDAEHHDRVMAITSHMPQLIAYTIVSTATDLEDDTKREVMKFSASGFRDFTRIAASDPVMWRDVYLNNKDAMLDVLDRFTASLDDLRSAIVNAEGERMFDIFTRTRDIRRGIIELRQDKPDIKPEDED